MKKNLHKKKLNIAAAVFGGLALTLTPFVCQASDYNDVDQVLENKVYIVGSISDINEVRSTLESLKLSGMTGAFVIEAEELKKYPQTVQLITREGHKIILRMKKQAVEKNPAKSAITTPVRQVETKPAATPESAKVKNETAKTKSAATPETATSKSETIKTAPAQPAEQSEIAAARKRLQSEEKEASGTKFVEKLPANVQTKEVKVAADTKLVEEPVEKPNQALKVVGQPTNSSRQNTRIDHPLTKKERIARDFLGVNEKGEQIALRYPGTAKDVNDVPDWSIASLLKLSDYGLLSPDDVRDILSEPDRELMAKMTARAYHLHKERGEKDNYNADFELSKLFKEYDTELRNLGYGALDYASYTPKPFNYEPEIGGELRYNYVDHSGDHPYNFYDHRIRFRPYVKQMVDENWYVYGMGEAIKSWVRHDIKNFSLIRLFVGGKYKDVNVRAGRYGEYYADGNIYDGRMDGVSFEGGETVKYKASYGRLRNDERGGAVIARYKEAKYETEAGIYSFDNIKGYGNDTIFALGGMYYIGNFGTGAMYLKSSKSDVSGDSDGYVITIQYGRHRTAVPGTFEIFAKYYDQADTTYISHTMSGLADYMSGFKGHSIGLYYTFAKNWEYAIEYYDLKEKGSGRKGRTLWNHVSYFFD